MMAIVDKKQDVGAQLPKSEVEMFDTIWLRNQLGYEPGRYDLWLQLGKRLRDDGRLAEAIDALRRATELRQDSSSAWLYLALAHKAKGNLEEAGHAWLKVKNIRKGLPFVSELDFSPTDL